MNLEIPKLPDIIQRLRRECNDYEQTVLALKAVSHELCWGDQDRKLVPESKPCLGRRMDTSVSNRVSPQTTVTPDLVVSFGDRGTLGEAKIALSNKPDLRERRFLDLQKYDDELHGWDAPDERVKGHDVVLIVHHSRGPAVAEQLDELTAANKFKMSRSFGVISFVVNQQSQTFLALQLVSGKLDDPDKTRKLRFIVNLPLGYVAANPAFANVKLYDQRPPDPLLMQLVYETVQSGLSPEQCDRLNDEYEVPVEISLDELQSRIAVQHGPGAEKRHRTPEIPRKAWLADVVERFIDLKWASWSQSRSDTMRYVVKSRRRPFEQFLHLCAKLEEDRLKANAEAKAAEAYQPLLFKQAGSGGRAS